MTDRIARPSDAVRIIDEYVAAVLGGYEPASRLVRLACQRHRQDCERDDLAFDPAPVDDWLTFCRQIRHPRGDAAERGEYFEPLPWQVFCIGSVLGWRAEPSGHRRYRLAIIEVARGNGKTVLMASVCLRQTSRYLSSPVNK